MKVSAHSVIRSCSPLLSTFLVFHSWLCRPGAVFRPCLYRPTQSLALGLHLNFYDPLHMIGKSSPFSSQAFPIWRSMLSYSEMQFKKVTSIGLPSWNQRCNAHIRGMVQKLLLPARVNPGTDVKKGISKSASLITPFYPNEENHLEMDHFSG